MKLFGYIDDILISYYHLFDSIQGKTLHLMAAICVLIIFLWLFTKLVGLGRGAQ